MSSRIDDSGFFASQEPRIAKHGYLLSKNMSIGYKLSSCSNDKGRWTLGFGNKLFRKSYRFA